jgi:hypothetical protein
MGAAGELKGSGEDGRSKRRQLCPRRHQPWGARGLPAHGLLLSWRNHERPGNRPEEVTMARIELPDVGELAETIRFGVERKIGKLRPLYTGEDLIEDVGLSQSQFEDLLGELEQEFSVHFDAETIDQLTSVGALVVRLLRLCSREVHSDGSFQEVA